MEDFFDTFDSPIGLVKMTKDEFIEKTRAMLSDLLKEYDSRWETKDLDKQCESCLGCAHIVIGGNTLICPSCEGDGMAKERVFNADGFIEHIEEYIIFGNHPFFELLGCEIID